MKIYKIYKIYERNMEGGRFSTTLKILKYKKNIFNLPDQYGCPDTRRNFELLSIFSLLFQVGIIRSD